MCAFVFITKMLELLTVLSQHIGLSTSFREFVDPITCNENNKNCIDRFCSGCQNLFFLQFQPNETENLNELPVSYYQWQAQDKRMKKVLLQAPIGQFFNELELQLKPFLIHRYIKK